MHQLRILRRPEVERMTGLSRQGIYDCIHRAGFPRPVKLGGRASGWVESEVQAWIEARISDRDDSPAQ